MTVQAQLDSTTKKVIVEFERHCPIYILDNYCSKIGLTNIISSAKTDERVGGIDNRNENDNQRPEIAIKYYDNIIVFNKSTSSQNLSFFRIYFKSEKNLELFTLCYKYLMDFIVDDSNSNRYFNKEAPMNAIIKNSYPDKNFYMASCFVWQPGYCK